MLAGVEKALQGQDRKEKMTAVQALLHGLIDYAGLFPPAGLDMPTAVRNYESYRSGDHAWMLGRFILPAQRLSEFRAAFNEACCDELISPWLLSILGSGNAEEDARLIEEFIEGAAFLDSIETKAVSIEQELQVVRTSLPTYVEFDPALCDQMVPVLAKHGARAKIRTGGLTLDAFPSAAQLAHFLVVCAQAKVPFKATAGLHHPVRSVNKLTYEPDSASATMHGFINVFVAATMAYYGAREADVLTVLEEEDPAAFAWSKTSLKWRNQRLSMKQVKEARSDFAISFGSCSFVEPIADLQKLGWL
jgi:hypothetical protein